MQPNRGAANTQWVQPPMETQLSNQGHSNGDIWPDPEVNGRGRLPEHDPTKSGYATNALHEGRPLSINDIDRPVFVNHYYAAGEPQFTSKRLIRIDECDEQSMYSLSGTNTKGVPSKHSKLLLHLMDMPTSVKNIKAPLLLKERQRGFHSEPVEHSLHSPRMVSVGKSWVQAADDNCVEPQQVPLTGHKNYHQEFQTYPASREPVMVQPTATTNNMSNSALMDLPNVNTNLPPPLVPQQAQCHSLHRRNLQLQLTQYPVLKS